MPLAPAHRGLLSAFAPAIADDAALKLGLATSYARAHQISKGIRAVRFVGNASQGSRPRGKPRTTQRCAAAVFSFEIAL